MEQARNKVVSFLTKSQMKLLRILPRPWQKHILCWTFMNNWKIWEFSFSSKTLQKASERLLEASERRPPKGLRRFFRVCNLTFEVFEKVHRRVLRTTRRCGSSDRPNFRELGAKHSGCEALFLWIFSAQKVDRPAKKKISAEQRLIMVTTVKWSLHQGSNDVSNWVHDIVEVRKEAVSFLT